MYYSRNFQKFFASARNRRATAVASRRARNKRGAAKLTAKYAQDGDSGDIDDIFDDPYMIAALQPSLTSPLPHIHGSTRDLYSDWYRSGGEKHLTK